MNLSRILQKLLGREAMLHMSYFTDKCGVAIVNPMRSLDPPRNDYVLFGEYIRASSLELGL
jgi:hypothetical protein